MDDSPFKWIKIKYRLVSIHTSHLLFLTNAHWDSARWSHIQLDTPFVKAVKKIPYFGRIPYKWPLNFRNGNLSISNKSQESRNMVLVDWIFLGFAFALLLEIKRRYNARTPPIGAVKKRIWQGNKLMCFLYCNNSPPIFCLQAHPFSPTFGWQAHLLCLVPHLLYLVPCPSSLIPSPYSPHTSHIRAAGNRFWHSGIPCVCWVSVAQTLQGLGCP